MESYYGFEEKSFFWHSSFLATAFHISPFSFFFSFFFFFQVAGGILEVENVKAGAWERGRERGGLGRAVLTGKRC